MSAANTTQRSPQGMHDTTQADAHELEHWRREHLLHDVRNAAELNDAVLAPMRRAGVRYWMLFAILLGLLLMFGVTWVYQMYWGLGVTGLTRPVMWAVYIVNFVYFIGIGHAGTFISAALRALKVEWRRPISRAAELVTVFGLMAAALFPLIHIGRFWKFYWMMPFPNQRQLWPSYHSPIIWDMTAILTYLSCSVLFVYLSAIPDLAMARDHVAGWRKKLYTLLSFGWRGTEREWANHEMAANIFTYGIIPVMFSVHTVVSWDFAMALQPGWHSSIFGPYFVVGALFSGVAAVIIALVIVRQTMNLAYFVRFEHFDGMAKFLLLLSLAWDYFYFNEFIVAWYGQEPVEKGIITTLTTGWAAPWFYVMLFCNVIVPLALVAKRVRHSLFALVIVSLLVQVGMYIERLLIVPVGLSHQWLPFSWGYYTLRLPETLITIGAFALVFFGFVAVAKLLPFVPVWEVGEGQVLHGLRRIGRALVSTKAEH